MTEAEQTGLAALQRSLQHDFNQPALLVQALTHRSFSSDHNERLEFLGDSVLSLAVSDLLYKRLAQLPEGDLSRVRANLVKQDTLHQLAVSLRLPDVIRLGEGEMRSGGQKRPSILADALESVIGAVYLDGGFTAAQGLVQRLFNSVEINQNMDAIGKDAKTELQEWLQGRKMKLLSGLPSGEAPASLVWVGSVMRRGSSGFATWRTRPPARQRAASRQYRARPG